MACLRDLCQNIVRTMIQDLDARAAVLPGDFESLGRQLSVFTILNLCLLAILLVLHIWFASFWGKPSLSLTILLATCFAARTMEWVWLRKRTPTPHASAIVTTASMALNLGLAIVLATVIDREDSQYFALLVVPILESAFRFSLAPTLAVVAAADGITFYWVWRYFHAHPPVDIGEYFEAGTISIIFLIVGVLISMMVRHLGNKQAQLAKVRERLLQEEKLAAVGRISSALAHEIRNPVAMISSSLSTAKTLAGAEREEMFEIATQEASRLVQLTSALLAYARPRKAVPTSGALRDAALYVAEACRAHAQAKSINVRVDAPDAVIAEYDLALLQQALMNVVINALEASLPGQQVELTVGTSGTDRARIDVENGGGPIPFEVAEHLFEPFFTTKTAGSGLGLATAHSAMRTQGGDLVLSSNSQRIRFSLILPRRSALARVAAGS